jgi:hypothetical protein
MKWILALLQLFVKTLTVTINIDLRLQTVKGYIDGMKVLNISNFGSSFIHKVWKFTIELNEGVFLLSYNGVVIYSTTQYQNISIMYHDKQLSVNGFVIPFKF